MYVSLKDVAARAGVSFQTASKVLNGQLGVVSEATRERILAAAGDLGYVPNALARGLVRQSSVTVGVLSDDVSDWALSQFVVGAQRAAEMHGHAALIVSTDPDGDPGRSVRKLMEHRVDGILVMAPSLEDDERLGVALRQQSLPVVSINHVPGGGVPVVGSDHRATGTLAGHHLLQLGHRRIGTVVGPRRRRVVGSRLQGFRAALRDAGRGLPPRRIVEGDWTPPGGYRAMQHLLEADPGLSAVFVHSDVMAMGCLRALRERGLRVPDDVSVVGCDDLLIAEFLDPPLTTVQVPFQDTGARAATLLLERIGGNETPRHEHLPVEMVLRQSTGPPPTPVRGPVPQRRRKTVAALQEGDA